MRPVLNVVIYFGSLISRFQNMFSGTFWMVLIWFHFPLLHASLFYTFIFHLLIPYCVTLLVWIVDNAYFKWSYVCSYSNFTPISLSMIKCIREHTLICVYILFSCQYWHADIKSSKDISFFIWSALDSCTSF